MSSTQVGSIHYDLNLNTRNFDEGIKNVSSKLSDVGKGMADFGQTLTTKVTLPLAAFTGGMVASAAQLEKTAASFNVLVGEGTKARKLFADIKKFADTTPFEFPELAKAATTMLGYGVAAEDVMDRLKRLGDAAAASGGDLNGITLAYSQMIGRGKVTGDNLRQLTENMVTLRAELSKVSGIPMNQLDKAVEGGLITTQMLNDALDMATNKGGKFFGGTERLALTFSGRLSTVKDQLLEVGRNLIGVKVDPELGLTVKEGGVFDTLSKLLPKIADGAKTLGAAFESLSAAQQKIVIGGAGVLAALGPTLMVLGNIIKVGSKVAAVLGSALFLKVAVVMAIVAAAVYLIYKNWDTLVGFYNGYIQPMLISMRNFLQPVTDVIVRMIDLFKTYLLPALQQVGTYIVSSFKPAWESIKTAFDNFKLAIEPFMPFLKQFAQNALIGIAIAIGVVVAAIVGIITAIGYLVGAFIRVQTAIQNVINTFYSFAISARDAVWNGLMRAVDVANSFIGSMWNAGRRILDGFIDGIKGGFDRAVQNVRDGLNRIRRMLPFSPAKEGPFSGKGWTLYSGQSLMKGLADGIKQNSNLPQLALNNALAGAQFQIAGNTQPAPTPTSNTSININGDIKLGDQSAVQEFFGRLNRNNELAQKGMAVM